jgi:hypothetical protein
MMKELFGLQPAKKKKKQHKKAEVNINILKEVLKLKKELQILQKRVLSKDQQNKEYKEDEDNKKNNIRNKHDFFKEEHITIQNTQIFTDNKQYIIATIHKEEETKKDKEYADEKRTRKEKKEEKEEITTWEQEYVEEEKEEIKTKKEVIKEILRVREEEKLKISNLKKEIVDNQQLCSKASFYRYIKELKRKKQLTIIKSQHKELVLINK